MAYLEVAADIYDSTGHFIMNPRDIQATSLLSIDEDWVTDFNRYLQTRRFYQDYDKRPKGLK